MSLKSKRNFKFESEYNFPLPEGANGVPWAEWTDSDLNNEKWEYPKNGPDELFLDIHPPAMPPSLKPLGWVRAKDMKHLIGPLTVFVSSPEYPDLIINNKHLLHSEFIRWFISALINLHYFWNSRHQPWQGWMQVYSMNKAGKGTQHRPIVNPNGKYIVRLYFMGSWRRIIVDDMVPVNEDGKVLLPLTGNNFEIWPIILAKALLKVASLTWSPNREIVDFDPISSLTGWVKLNLNIKHLSPQDKYDFLIKYVKPFDWAAEEGTQEKSQGITLFIKLKDMKNVPSNVAPGLAPCWSHVVYITQFRDVPLDSKNIKPPLPRWKFYRWVKWATAKGLIDPVDYFVPNRFLKIVSPLKEYSGDVENSDNEVEYNNIYKQKERNQQEESDSKQNNVQNPWDISAWCDFNKLSPYIEETYLFYNSDQFQYTAKVSEHFKQPKIKALKEDQRSVTTRIESKKGSGKSSSSRITQVKEPEFTDTLNWPEKILTARNEPLYLFCDSLESKFFLINFSTVPPVSVETPSEINVPKEGLKNYLIIERYNWFFRPTRSEILTSFSTNGTKATVFELEPGRHLLRIFCRSETRCFLTISSDTIFHLGDRMKMHRLMSTEAERIDVFAKNVCDYFIKALRAFGTKDYSGALRDFYQSYLPVFNVPEKRKKSVSRLIHESFTEKLVNLLKKCLSEEEIQRVLRSLKIFFLDPTIGADRLLHLIKDLHDIKSSKTRRFTFETITEKEDFIDHNEASIKIQSFFKMIIIKKYKLIHNPLNNEHKEIQVNLQKIINLFDYSKKDPLMNILLRNLVKNNENFLKLYPWSKDLQHVLQIQNIKGTLVNIKSHQWLPIARLITNPVETETAFVAMYLFIDLPRYSLRVFENETGREMLRLANNVAPGRYRYSKKGYTIFAYGWSESDKLKELEWSMHVISMKGEPLLYGLKQEERIPLEAQTSNLIIEELVNVYIPNVKNRVCKWIVKILAKTILSIRLEVSYNLARIRLQVFNDNKVLYEMDGVSVMIMPFVCLEYNEDGSHEKLNTTRDYYVEALILNDSWPLSQAEWSVVAEAKEKEMFSTVKKKLSSVSDDKLLKAELQRNKKMSKQLNVRNNKMIESPYWILQVVTDAGTSIQVLEDRRREKEITSIIESWSLEDPERSERGKKLRDAFLSKHITMDSTWITEEEE